MLTTILSTVYNDINNQDWDTILANDDDLDENYTQLTTTILEIVRQHITINKVKLRPHDKPWYNNNLRQLKKKTLRLRKHAQHVKTEDAWIKYRQSRNKLNSLIRQTKREYPSKLGEKLKQDIDNPKMWWKTVNALMKGSNTQSLPPTKNQESGAVITDSEDKANLLNDYFTSQTYCLTKKVSLHHWLQERQIVFWQK